jgi:dimethylamine/trimethylamine dehydrogenase
VTAESRLPGLNAWGRVRDWRVARIREMTNVEVYLDSELTAENILEFGFNHVILATGARWRTDGVGVTNWDPIAGSDQMYVLTPTDIAAGCDMAGPVVVFDDDNFYLGGVVAEKLRNDGYEVTLVATAPEVSPWTRNTLEQHRIQARVLELGIDVITAHNVVNIGTAALEVACIYTGRRREVSAGTLVMITSRRPNSEVYLALTEDAEKLAAAGIDSVSAIGDCSCPSTIAAAVYDGHRAARELDAVNTSHSTHQSRSSSFTGIVTLKRRRQNFRRP